MNKTANRWEYKVGIDAVIAMLVGENVKSSIKCKRYVKILTLDLLMSR